MLERTSWFVLALIHLTPAIALFAPGMISRLYGVERSTDVFPLLHHRSGLFACVFVVCIWAAFDHRVSQLAVVVVALSMLSFLTIYFANASPPSLRTIAIADLIGVPFLMIVGWKAFLSA